MVYDVSWLRISDGGASPDAAPLPPQRSRQSSWCALRWTRWVCSAHPHIYICIYICIYIYMYMYIYVYVYICICIYYNIYILHTHKYIKYTICICIYTQYIFRMGIMMCFYLYIYIHIHIRILMIWLYTSNAGIMMRPNNSLDFHGYWSNDGIWKCMVFNWRSQNNTIEILGLNVSMVLKWNHSFDGGCFRMAFVCNLRETKGY